MKAKILVILCVLVLALLFGCTQSTPPTQQQNQSSAPVTTTASNTSVLIQSFAFNPQNITIKAGTTVTWANNDSVSHTIVGDGINSPVLAQGESYSQTFNTAGTINYHCSIHPSMTGTITVE